MSASEEGTVRRLWRTGVIVGLVVAVGALAGCSASDDSSSAGDPEIAQEAAAGDSGKDAGGANSNGGVVAAPEAAPQALIITGSLYITVKDPLAAADEAAGIVKAAGGRIDARNEVAPDDNDGGSAALTLRIPNDDLDDVVDDLRALGTVDSYTTDSINVSNEVTDLEARISTLRDSTDRIQGLLADATSISDIITLENELANRQAELQSLEAQQRGLDDQVAMSTIDLSLTTEPVVIDEVDNSPKSFWDGLVSGWNGLVSFVSVALVIIGLLLPWAILGGIITVAIVAMARAAKKRSARKAPRITPYQGQYPIPGQAGPQAAAPPVAPVPVPAAPPAPAADSEPVPPAPEHPAP